MIIKQLDLQDLKPCLKMPQPEELHVWIITFSSIENVHKDAQTQSHSLLFKMLSGYTGIPAEDLELETEKHGKPCLKKLSKTGERIPELYFNISHSGSCAAFIFSSSVPVGIDIERLGRPARMDRIAGRIFFPDEAAQIHAMQGEHMQMEKTRLFFRLWTRTESFLKGIGTGFSASLSDAAVKEEYAKWKLHYLDAPEGYICCIAYRP